LAVFGMKDWLMDWREHFSHNYGCDTNGA
jgi:hypothetical protein